MDDPEMASLFIKCLSHLFSIMSCSKKGMQEACEELAGINDFYLERVSRLPFSVGPKKIEIGSVEIQSTKVSQPFVFDPD
ncbi:MAG: hypothetical protein HC812_02010 [Leptolyngbya sp. RL_3_1]|nr:hypothetical protein [Leptolyngbya sp. RL_3_1]